MEKFLGLNLYPKFSKRKPNGYLQPWQIEILKNAWINNIGYLFHQLKMNVQEDFDRSLALEEWLDIWNGYYELYSHLMPDFRELEESRMADKWNELNKNKVEERVPKPLKKDIFVMKPNQSMDMG